MRRIGRVGLVMVVAQSAALLCAGSASAQGSACDQLKATLAARIAPGIGAYTLEAVPAGTPLPPGAKAIGTCEGGARKIVLRRGGAVQASSGADSAAAIAPSAATPPPAIEAPRAAASAARRAEREVVQPVAIRVDESAAAPASPARQAFEWVGRHWPWLIALLLLLALAWPIGAWVVHRRAYDEAGLPRGPRLD